ncbi:WbqC family protein [Hymenobacter taeanensis]|uniref:WbqC family protein n=1 Tax=Hymenobacter taeanensis TaxID=2735321 RepID=A0A6M6BGA1_9BACT|nr:MULTISPECIES: WbqC family protein [Hymenobacter]QJX47551.1 WbqC family protein [Hymenobacter taeanensis]UOQ82965.1 WbqC family protein [Hymenobacter sp. 5414T-23]
MKLAIMQPYLFPYIGYFQLLNIVDKFIIYDDVNFINKGWINRNNILVNNKASMFTVPLKEASQNKLIKDINVVNDNKWASKLMKSIELSYKKSPYFENVYPIVVNVIDGFSGSISTMAYDSIIQVSQYLEIYTNVVESSSVYNNAYLKGQDRILDICSKEKADCYINPIGGIDLYNKNEFNDRNIQLSFIKSNNVAYSQNSIEFVASLSIIDVLMNNSIDQVKCLLSQFTLIK